jgi:hypothetical protein
VSEGGGHESHWLRSRGVTVVSTVDRNPGGLRSRVARSYAYASAISRCGPQIFIEAAARW